MKYLFGGAFVLAIITLFASESVATPRAIVRQTLPLPPLGQSTDVDRRIVTILQQQLRALGYTTAVSGFIGADTRAAIMAFARTVNIPETGPDTDRIVAIDHAYGVRFDPFETMPD